MFFFFSFFSIPSFIYALTSDHHKPYKQGHDRRPGKVYNEELKDSAHQRRHSYRQGGFAFLGTLVLWAIWPMFNAALAPSAAQGRVVATTVVALLASTSTAISLSYLLHGAMHLRSFLNATLAGGAVMGCAHSVVVPPWIAGEETEDRVCFFVAFFVNAPFFSKSHPRHLCCSVLVVWRVGPYALARGQRQAV